MYLFNIKLWNFRKFGSVNGIDLNNPNLDLNFTNGLNVLIGENDSGKTGIIDAIKLVLKTHSYDWLKTTHEDFFNDSARIRIELIFKDLFDEEAKNFTEWLGWEEKILENDGATEKVQVPYLRLIYDVSRNLKDYYIFPTDIKAGVDESGYPLTAEAREYLKVTYLKPLRDAKEELIPRKNSRLSQILQGHDAFKGKEETHILVGIFREFNTSVEKYFVGKDKDDQPLPEPNQKGKELKDEIDRFIKAFYSTEKESNFGVVGSNLKNILEKLELSLKDEINPGLGTLNRLFMSSELLHLQKKNWNGIRLGLIEELEAHLHPQAQMKIIESLQQENNIQLILTTHSPNLGSKIKLENLILCNSSSAFPLGLDYTKLAEEDYIFLERFLDVTKANLFFAKGVIMVEGWAEEILLPALAKKLKSQNIISKNLTDSGVSIVNIGNTAFLKYSKIFLRKKEGEVLDIPISVITDVDIPEYEKTPRVDDDGKVIKNTRGKTEYIYEKRESEILIQETTDKKATIISKLKGQKVDVFVAPNWTLEYSILKSTSLGTKFCEVFKKIHPDIDEMDFEKELATKLINKGLNKTEIAYELAQALESTPDLVLDETDAGIKYIIDAIKYVCND
ncbi:MAG: AAA family ATPase [Bacteroidia bacterium]|nr:AAA family ATPase [Bacteroidia bacterium]